MKNTNVNYINSVFAISMLKVSSDYKSAVLRSDFD